MARATPMQASVNGGEISPLMMGRVDQNVYSIAAEKMENFVPLIQGPMLKRSGIRHVETAKGPHRLIPFEFNTTQAYMIEAGEAYLRFYTNNVRIETSPGVAYELTSPYTYAEIGAVDYHASGDVLYLVHPGHAPQTLSRLTGTTFAFAALALSGGPFDDDNIDETITVAATASTGNVTLYASGADIFTAGHVGGLFRMEARDFSEIPSWEPDITVDNGRLLTWEGKVYQVVGGTGRTGTVPPIHSEGIEWDGIANGTDRASRPAGGVQLLYLHDRFGILKITAFTSARQVSATVLKRLPFGAALSNTYAAPIDFTPPYNGGTPSYTSAGQPFYRRFNVSIGGGGEPVFTDVDQDFIPSIGDGTAGGGGTPVFTPYLTPGTWRWAFGAFSVAKGWPEKVFIWNERLIFTKGATIYASVVGAYTDFRERNEAGEITADMAFRATLNSPNAIRWIAGDEQLLIGSAKQEHVGGAMGGDGIPGPGNFKAPAQTDFGSAAVKPVSVGGRVLFVDKSGRRIYELDFTFQRDRFDADDLTIMADHVTKGGVIWMARQASPHSLVWIGTGAGTLAAMSYSPKQEVKSWARFPLTAGSLVRSGACIPDPAGASDQLWLSVERAGKWLIGYVDPYREPADALASAFHVDQGLSYTGAATARVSGLGHLIGETVQYLAGGRAWGSATVDALGGIDLPITATPVHAGLPYRAYFKSLRIEAGADDGTAQGKLKRISRLVARLLDTLGLRARVQDGDWQEMDPLLFGATLDAIPAPITGDWLMDVIGDYDRDGQVEFESAVPLPACILALTPTIKTGST